jgi:hypothetical protein
MLPQEEHQTIPSPQEKKSLEATTILTTNNPDEKKVHFRKSNDNPS